MFLGDWIRRAQFWLRRERLTDELDEEMRLHVELRARANRERGLSTEDAELAARRQFGNRLVLRDAGRDAWGFLMLERLLQDSRYGIRQLLKHRATTAAAVLTLALGIGANTALFTVINAVVLKAAPIADPDRVVWLGTTQTQRAGFYPLSYPDYLVYRDRPDLFQGVAAYAPIHLAIGGASPERVEGRIVSSNYFDVLGVKAEIGRTFDPAAVAAAGDRIAVVGHALWQRRFGGETGLVGRDVILNGQPFTVVGVLPRGFSGLEMPDTEEAAMFVPLESAPVALPGGADRLRDARDNWLWSAARLQPGVSMAQASAAVAALGAHAPSVSAESPDVARAVVMPIQGGLHPDERAAVAPVLWLLMAVPGLVLIVACANVANLLLARGVARRRELALRRAIGATRGRLIRQLLTESVVLAIAGGLLAMAVSSIFIQTIASIAGMPGPMLEAITPDARVFELTLAVALVSVVVFGLAPALSATAPRLTATFTDDAAVDAGGRRRRLRGAFVVTQIAVSMTLLVAATLFLQSLGQALHVDPGFDPRNVMTFSYDLRLQGYVAPRDTEFHRALLERLQSTPGVQAAALAAPLPLSGEMYGHRLQPEAATLDPMRIHLSRVSPDYFATLGLPLVRGRIFSAADVQGSTEVAIVNETLARALAQDGEAIGKRFRFDETGEPWRTIVGIARDSRYEILTEPPRPFVYLPWTQYSTPTASALVRARGDVTPTVLLVDRAVHALDPNLPLYRVSLLEHNIRGTVDVQRATAALLGVFGTLAMLLAAVGVYAVTAHGVTSRTREIGIRISLGARTAQVLRLFVGEGVKFSIIGVGVGVALSVAAAGLLEAFLFGVRATDALTFVAVATLLCVVAILASYFPARRAAGMDPLRALRHD